MLKVLKINTAVIICLAFIFRMLLINGGLLSSTNSTTKNKSFTKTQIAFNNNSKRSFDAPDNSIGRNFLSAEICEESSDNEEDDSSKTSAFIILQVLYSSFINDITLRSNTLFDHINHKVPSKKYLAISVLRI